MRFFLLNPKKCITFAVEMIHAGACGRVCLPFTLTESFKDIIKSVYWRLFWYSETWKISTYPKQEGSKRPWGYDYPAHRASFVGLLCLVAFHIRRGRSLLILIGKVLQDLRVENKQR